MDSIPDPRTDSPKGLIFAITAYMMWGVLPVFMKALSHLPAAEIIAHRVLWSLPIAGAVLIWQGRTTEVHAALRSPRLLAMAALTAILISANWTIYVWAIANGHTLDAALGYYINPLFSIFLGATLLKEKLSRGQIAAIALAAFAVIILTISAGTLPLVAVGLTLSWGFYAYCKKSLPLGPNQGFTLEVLLLTPFAAAFLIWQPMQGQAHFAQNGFDTVMLIACGPITAIPLLFYANGAKLIRLSTIGILQYIAPTMIFLCAVILFHEPFEGARLVAFPMIWAALVIYTVTLLGQARQRRRAKAPTRSRIQ
ncbi:EamA family transporter RarD [Paracoccus sp. JM45]|uniref:EamA family transporter RarD n=1 Tax=Paracoccus sp. JM45 TaxID=2283626 RepID=UPI000E6C2454|nr:EamA family transporter RarD [Paracoccus sp. JM45]RJE80437.1 EamA family transporter RarD [Paracoccus sp. JM45]